MREVDGLTRRTFVRSGALSLAGLIFGARASRATLTEPARGDEIPEAVKRVLEHRFGKRGIREGHVQLDVPEVAPDSREVPVFIETDLPMKDGEFVKGIHVIVDHNPDIYVAGFTLSPALGAASIDTRIKMRRSSHVRAIVETSSGQLWSGAKFVYTTLNGCV